MGSWGLETNRPHCDRFGCNRRAYVEGDVVQGFLCYVCDSADRRERALRRWRGPVGRLRSSLLQQHLDDERCGHITLLFLFGDGWSQQCGCTRCERQWLNAGWVCPVEHHWRRYLYMLDDLFIHTGYAACELRYVDWQAAVRRIHDMLTDEIPCDIPALVEFAELSARRVRDELREMHPDEHGEPLGEMHPGEHGGFEGTLARSALSLDNEVP